MAEECSRRVRISMATPQDRRGIYAMRHDVYACELGQHRPNPGQMLSDALDDANEYVVAHIGGELAGFISITPPSAGRYSIEKYVPREELALAFDDGLYELRVLTVAREHRHSRLAAVLMYAAFRWVEERGGRHVVAMGRSEVVSLYLKHGVRPMHRQVRSGAVTFELLETTIGQLCEFAERHHAYYKRLLGEIEWQCDFPFFKAACCFHGGAFFEAIGEGFETLERSRSIVNADVLDAWFPPAPGVVETVQEHLPWLMRTSPPTQGAGLRQAIARARGVEEECVLPGAGSSDLIYLAFRQWLTPHSRVLILDPTYGEYAHVLERVVGCTVDRLQLSRRDGYAADMDELEAKMRLGYDLVVLVNPNSPTGQHISRRQLEGVLVAAPANTRVWVDETYIEYAGRCESLERFAAASENVVVCKSMSKVYALSGMRAAYLCGGMHQLSELAAITPPWAVSLPAQVAAVRALEDEAYYEARYRETRGLRAELCAGLRRIGIEEIVPGVANFVMCHLRPDHPTAAEVVAECRREDVFVRDVSSMGSGLGVRALRIAVKTPEENAAILRALARALGTGIEREIDLASEPLCGVGAAVASACAAD
jgi:histidinol-phosphate/aromatic aminotransferase/cobyric acid decarboxylase-like protein